MKTRMSSVKSIIMRVTLSHAFAGTSVTTRPAAFSYCRFRPLHCSYALVCMELACSILSSCLLNVCREANERKQRKQTNAIEASRFLTSELDMLEALRAQKEAEVAMQKEDARRARHEAAQARLSVLYRTRVHIDAHVLAARCVCLPNRVWCST